MAESDLERAFETRWRQIVGEVSFEREFVFDKRRKWRFDFADPTTMVAVELHGGTWSRGRHVRGDGFERDREKMNAAVAAGWVVFELTGGLLDRDPYGVLMRISDTMLMRERLLS